MKLLTLVALIATAPIAQAQIHSYRATGEGGSSTGGADHQTGSAEHAWYLGHDQVRSICIAGRSKSYPVTDDQARAAITTAYATWREYVTKKVLPRYGREFTPSTQIRWESCTDTTELKIYLGTLTDELEKIKNTFVDPMAFVYQGAIWFNSSNGSLKSIQYGNSFLGLALHEIGHTLGLPHVPGTIMTADIIKFLHKDTLEEEAKVAGRNQINMDPPAKWRLRDRHLTEIEYEKALVFSCDEDFRVTHELKATEVMEYVPIRSAEKTFELFTGRKAQGRISVSFVGKIKGTFMDDSIDEDKGTETKFQLILKDTQGEYNFELEYELSSKMQREIIIQDLFSVRLPDSNKTLKSHEVRLNMKVTAKTGKVYELTGTYWGGNFLNLSYLDQEPQLPEILKASPHFSEEISEAAMKKLRTAWAPYHLFNTQSDIVFDQWIW